MKKKYKKKVIKQKHRISEAEEHPEHDVQLDLFADIAGESTKGGDYVDHTAEEVDPVQRDIQHDSVPVGYIGTSEYDFPTDVDWSQQAIDTRKKRLYGGRTREGIKNQFNFTSGLLNNKYVCLNCHRLYKYQEKRCYHCNSLTTAVFNKKSTKKKKTTIPIFSKNNGKIFGHEITKGREEIVGYETIIYTEEPRAFEYIRELTEKPLLQLEEVPGTRLKSSGKKLPGIYAHKDDIDKLRIPFTEWLNDGWSYGQTVFRYAAYKPERYTIYDKTYTVVTNYLERLKLIRLQLWNQLYSSIGGLGDFKDIKKVTFDKNMYIKLSIPDAAGYYPYSAKHPASNKMILILSPEPEPEFDACEDIQPVKIGRSDQVLKRLNLSPKNILYDQFKEAIHALIFHKDKFIIVIPQEKSFIFPLVPEDLNKWDTYYLINFGGTLNERNPSGPTKSYIEWDLDDYYDEI